MEGVRNLFLHALPQERLSPHSSIRHGRHACLAFTSRRGLRPEPRMLDKHMFPGPASTPDTPCYPIRPISVNSVKTQTSSPPPSFSQPGVLRLECVFKSPRLLGCPSSLWVSGSGPGLGIGMLASAGKMCCCETLMTSLWSLGPIVLPSYGLCAIVPTDSLSSPNHPIPATSGLPHAWRICSRLLCVTSEVTHN